MRTRTAPALLVRRLSRSVGAVFGQCGRGTCALAGLATALTVYSLPLLAQPGALSVVVDPPMVLDCHLENDTGTFTIHVLHRATSATAGARYRLDLGASGLTVIDEHIPHASWVGTALTGIEIRYDGFCHVAPVIAHSITVVGNGAGARDAWVCALAHSLTGRFDALDCTGEWQPMAESWPLVVNGVSSWCQDLIAAPNCIQPVSISHFTWGKIKAMYVR